jgi:integrase
MQIQQSLSPLATPPFVHTPNHIDCPACNEFLVRIQAPAVRRQMRFAVAAPLWLADHKPAIAEKTHADYEFLIRSLNRFFGELPLEAVHVGHMNAYSAERTKTVGASLVNHELNTLKQVLECAGLWRGQEIAKFYKPLRTPKPTVGQALEPAEEDRLFRVASSNYRWRIAYWCSILTATTTAGPGEIAHLHLNDISFVEDTGGCLGTLRVRDGLKNGFRERLLPLNSSSRWAIAQIMARYYKLCQRLGIAPDPEHYILPGRKQRELFDPMKPMGSWKHAWQSLRKAAGLPKLRMYDLRHHAITKLMEDPDISERTVEEMAGHALSSRMKKRYSHIRLRPKAEATNKLELNLEGNPGKKPAASAAPFAKRNGAAAGA